MTDQETRINWGMRPVPPEMSSPRHENGMFPLSRKTKTQFTILGLAAPRLTECKHEVSWSSSSRHLSILLHYVFFSPQLFLAPALFRLLGDL